MVLRGASIKVAQNYLVSSHVFGLVEQIKTVTGTLSTFKWTISIETEILLIRCNTPDNGSFKTRPEMLVDT